MPGAGLPERTTTTLRRCSVSPAIGRVGVPGNVAGHGTSLEIGGAGRSGPGVLEAGISRVSGAGRQVDGAEHDSSDLLAD